MNPSRLLRLLLPVALALGQAAAGASVVGEAARPGLETIAAGIRGPASTVGRSGPVRSTGHASFLSRGVMAAGLAQQPQRFLGYEIEEERRYVLGPDDSARRDTGFWSIRLAEIFEVDGEPEALFTLIHEWAAPPVLGDPVLGQIRNVNSEGEVRVNVHGFPLMIRVQTTRHLAGMGEEAYTVEYVLEDENQRSPARVVRFS